MAASSEEMDQVDAEDEAAARPSGEQRRAESGPIQRSEIRGVAFDDVTPTRSLAEVGLADMDEDLPTRMQSLDELARFRTAAADEVAAAAPKVEAPIRRDVVRPPPADPAPASEAVAFRSFPAPAGRDSVPVVPPAPAVPREASELSDERRESEPALAPIDDAPPSEPTDLGTRALLAISFALIVLAVAALVIERFVP